MKKSLHSSLMLALLVVLVFSLISFASAQDQITLEWWDYLNGGNDTKAIEDLISRFQESHPNITIERTVIPFGDLKTRVIQAAATGTMPDIVIIDNPDHQSMAAQGAFADITDAWRIGRMWSSILRVPGHPPSTRGITMVCHSRATQRPCFITQIC